MICDYCRARSDKELLHDPERCLGEKWCDCQHKVGKWVDWLKIEEKINGQGSFVRRSQETESA